MLTPIPFKIVQLHVRTYIVGMQLELTACDITTTAQVAFTNTLSSMEVK